MTVPVFINCRDRLAPLLELVAWLERAGVEEITFLDNESAYEPLLAYYEETPHRVVRMEKNWGKRALWLAPEAEGLTGDRPFVYTDPDIVPSEECPLDALDHFAELLDRYRGVTKAGFGLRIDDIPARYPHRDAVIAWEGQMWQWPLGDGNYFGAIDSTFALYRARAGLRPSEAVRTGPPYVARHTTWYVDPAVETEEDIFYRTRPGTRGNWNKDELPEWLAEAHEVMRATQPSPLRMAVRRAKLWPYLHWTLRGKPLPRALGWTRRYEP